MVSPLCEVKDGTDAYQSTSGGVDVTPAATITIRLIDTSADVWELRCISTDDEADADAVTNALAKDDVLRTATFTAPAAGHAYIFQSVVNHGVGPDGRILSSYTATFGVYTPTTNGDRVLALNETTQGGSFGWIVPVNSLIRNGGGGGGGGGSTTPGGAVNSVQYHGGGDIFSGAADVGISSGKLVLNATTGAALLPTTGDLRVGLAGVGAYYQSTFKHHSGVDKCSFYIWDGGLGIGDYNLDESKAPGQFYSATKSGYALAFSTQTPEGDYSGITVQAYPTTPFERRVMEIQYRTNLILYAHDQHALSAATLENYLCSGEGVFYMGDVATAPSTNPSSGIVLWVDSSTHLLKYRQPDGTVITVNGEVNTASNLGASGARVFSAKSGVDLQFRRLAAGSNVTLTENTNDITISAPKATPGGADNSVQFHKSDGTFDGATDVAISSGQLALNVSAGDLPDEGTIRVAGGGLNGAGFINYMRGVDATDGTTARNIGLNYGYTAPFGGGAHNIIGVFGHWGTTESKQPDIVEGTFRTALAFSYATQTPEGDYSGFHMDSWNVAGPLAGWNHRRAVVLHRHVNFALLGTRDHLANPEDGFGLGEGVAYWGWAEVNPTTNPTQGVTFWCDSSTSLLKYRKPDGTVITLDGVGEANTASNVGSGAGVFKAKTGADLAFKSIVAGSGISVTDNTNDIAIACTVTPGETNTASNLGSGAGLYASKSISDLQFKSIVAGSGVSVTATANDVTIASTVTPGETNTISNVGTGAQIAKTKSGVDFPLRSVLAGSGISVTQNTNDISIACTVTPGETNTISNTGAGAQVGQTKVGVNFPLRTIIGLHSVSVVQNTNTIDIDLTLPGSSGQLLYNSAGVNLGASTGWSVSSTGLVSTSSGFISFDTGGASAGLIRIKAGASRDVLVTDDGASHNRVLITFDSTSTGLTLGHTSHGTTINGSQVQISAGGSARLLADSTAVKSAVQILGDTSASSPYGAHGDVTITMASANKTLSASEYSVQFLRFTGTLSSVTRTVTLPAPAAGKGYSKDVSVEINEDAGIVFSIGSGKTAFLSWNGYRRATLSVTDAGVFVTGAVNGTDLSSMLNT